MPGIEPRLTMYKAISIPAVLSLIPALASEKCFSNYVVKGRRTRCSFPHNRLCQHRNQRHTVLPNLVVPPWVGYLPSLNLIILGDTLRCIESRGRRHQALSLKKEVTEQNLGIQDASPCAHPVM